MIKLVKLKGTAKGSLTCKQQTFEETKHDGETNDTTWKEIQSTA